MRFSHLLRILTLAAGAIGLFNLPSCSSSLEAGTDDNTTTQSITSVTIEEFPLEKLSQGEIDGLIFMREEEKLARDVYIACMINGACVFLTTYQKASRGIWTPLKLCLTDMN
jgi:hypothetical protein